MIVYFKMKIDQPSSDCTLEEHKESFLLSVKDRNNQGWLLEFIQYIEGEDYSVETLPQLFQLVNVGLTWCIKESFCLWIKDKNNQDGLLGFMQYIKGEGYSVETLPQLFGLIDTGLKWRINDAATWKETKQYFIKNEFPYHPLPKSYLYHGALLGQQNKIQVMNGILNESDNIRLNCLP